MPTTTAKPVLVSGDTREMLENVLAAAKEAAHPNLIRLADEAGEVGIRIRMETFVQDESTHRDETRKILQGYWG
ncbi:MAG: hypothetical protein IT210_25490 [Armatimonadetes bacterium]|nr:hypothetical protein [Armatimonadota bacterium]